MSTPSNDVLIERAQEQISYWEGELPSRLIQRDLEASDLEALAYHVSEAEKQMALQEDSVFPDGEPNVF